MAGIRQIADRQIVHIPGPIPLTGPDTVVTVPGVLPDRDILLLVYGLSILALFEFNDIAFISGPDQVTIPGIGFPLPDDALFIEWMTPAGHNLR